MSVSSRRTSWRTNWRSGSDGRSGCGRGGGRNRLGSAGMGILGRRNSRGDGGLNMSLQSAGIFGVSSRRTSRWNRSSSMCAERRGSRRGSRLHSSLYSRRNNLRSPGILRGVDFSGSVGVLGSLTSGWATSGRRRANGRDSGDSRLDNGRNSFRRSGILGAAGILRSAGVFGAGGVLRGAGIWSRGAFVLGRHGGWCNTGR